MEHDLCNGGHFRLVRRVKLVLERNVNAFDL
jgi:hypothetical protein